MSEEGRRIPITSDDDEPVDIPIRNLDKEKEEREKDYDRAMDIL